MRLDASMRLKAVDHHILLTVPGLKPPRPKLLDGEQEALLYISVARWLSASACRFVGARWGCGDASSSALARLSLHPARSDMQGVRFADLRTSLWQGR